MKSGWLVALTLSSMLAGVGCKKEHVPVALGNCTPNDPPAATARCGVRLGFRDASYAMP